MRNSMRDRTVLITGSTDGIGLYTALGLAEKGARVLLHGRNADKGSAALKMIRRRTGNSRVEFFLADLSVQGRVRTLAADIIEKHDHLDVLINNAGVYMPDLQLTEDGLEMTFAVNHLSHFLLTYLLLDLLKKSAPSRIINLSSVAHQSAILDWENLQGEKSYDGYQAYSLSKLACVLFTYELAERLEGTGVTANCLHPGVVDTKMLRAGWAGAFGIDPEKGAEASIYLASSPEVVDISGRYFDKKRIVNSSELSRDKVVQRKFWEIGEKLVGMS